MGIASAFYTALSGLSVNSASLTVIGNNLANLNTIGFKGSSTTFQDLFSTTLGGSAFQGNGNPSQVGLGATVGAVMQNFGQSTFQSTNNPTDMAIQGAGFFYVAMVNGGFGHSRAGNFTVDNFGFVVDPAGNKLQGYNRDARGVIDTTMGSTDIRIPVGETVSAFATQVVSFTTNLDSTSAPPNDRYTTSVKVYDSLGEQHTLLVTYDRIMNPGPPATPTNSWRYYVWAPDADSGIATDPPPPGPPQYGVPGTNGGPDPTTDYFALAEGVVYFGTDGKMSGLDYAYWDPVAGALVDGTTGGVGGGAGNGPLGVDGFPDNPTFPIQWKNGSANQDIQWTVNSGTPTAARFLVTQTASASGTSNSSQNGYGAGTIEGLTVDQNGFIIGTFTNGQTYPVARVALSIFTNNHGLKKVGENIWKETVASGPANIGTANDVGRGAVLGSHYEMSNVDVADEFTRLIITQRGYQANSRIVTTSDEMMQETLALKR